MNKRKLGFDKEELAVKFLKQNGYDVIERNFYTKMGEIDIVAKDGDYLCFVEVKYRKNDSDGFPEESVDFNKIKRISKAARVYITTKGYGEYYPCRFDVIAILGDNYKLIKNAFDACF